MKLAIVGSRTFNDYEKAVTFIDYIIDENSFEVSLIVSGDARGADSIAERYAASHGIETLIFNAEWHKYGKYAGYRRNKDIIDNCDACIAFWDGISKGTKNDIDLCEEKGKPLYVCRFSKKRDITKKKMNIIWIFEK